MILKIFLGSLLEVMTVVTPAAVAISAAISFVSIPPVPRLEPRVVVLTAPRFKMWFSGDQQHTYLVSVLWIWTKQHLWTSLSGLFVGWRYIMHPRRSVGIDNLRVSSKP